VSLAAAIVSLAWLSAGAQAPKTGDVVARVFAYVADYGAQLANVVAEETYRQRAPRASGPDQERTLRSDYALTWAGARDGWVGYRDTFEVDGLAVRDREQRLQRLLESGATGQAARIAEQNARFNLRNDLLPRTVNVPTFALDLLQPRFRDRFSARRVGSEALDGKTAWLVEFRERNRPTIVRTPEGRDQPSRIEALVDPATGEIHRTTVSWERVKGSIVVDYGRVPGLSVPVPITMFERFTTRDGDEISGDATYANYRRFETSGRLIEP
jgi:hypothetical protein